MTSHGPPKNADGDEGEGGGHAHKGEIVPAAHEEPPGSHEPPPVIPVVPVVVVNPQHLSGASPGDPPHLGPITEPTDEPGSAGMPVDPYQGKEQPTAPRPPAFAIGKFPFYVKHSDIPSDPITPWISGPVKRGRRSEWPVMIFVMAIVAIIVISCCIAGYGLYFRNHPP